MQSRQPHLMGRSRSSIIGDRYCAPYPISLAIVKNSAADGIFSVKDVNGNTVFNLKRPLSLHSRRILCDNTGQPVLTLRKNLMTAHNRWQVFLGESAAAHDLIFTIKRKNIFHLNSRSPDVFLVEFETTTDCCFEVEALWSQRNFKVIAVQSHSHNVVAEMYSPDPVQSSASFGEDFWVKVETNVDYAFIVAVLIVILHESN
ncbi:Tubby-like, C-terminal [Sesbania bispinosa]|nr:Tubby-like, C-terminal [Sesbania bispinosa]